MNASPPQTELLFLTGYRGSGKSTVARLIAARLGWECVDSDDVIEAEASLPIAQIFAEQGEPAFRDLEERAVAGLCTRCQTVVALGGGAVLRPATRARLRAAGPVVWLTASATTLAQRIAGDTASDVRRPRLTGLSGLAEVEQVLATREPIYRECATVAIDGEGRDPAAIADEVVDWLRGR
ncbi:shikimate kinase [Botrimarina hoheduenensis]|uniref:Shikimate kinase n=1 Tax=Botrimarina hoheduenensis TaxID=2528000 RepID=A0A5C5WE37_9BACT|nr:shikimate kinase [Botrimarina hoheduenensis]TWT48315.1 Shikimate kinase 2 [Botrimarina hoheduenensis]